MTYCLPQYQFQVRVCGLYLLYGLYFGHPFVPKVKVNNIQINEWWSLFCKWQMHMFQSKVHVIHNMVYRPSMQASFTIGSGMYAIPRNQPAARIAARHNIFPRTVPNMSWIDGAGGNISYPMFVEPLIIWVPSGFAGYIIMAWHKNCV